MDLNIKVWDPKDTSIIERFVETLNTVFAEGEFTEDFFLWKHRDNPLGSSIVTYAQAKDGTIAAVRCLWKSNVLYRGNSHVAYQPCDTATHPSYRRQGLFTKITKLAMERAKQEEAKFIYNFPNDQSKPGYMKLGWKEGCEVVKMFKVLSPIRFGLEMVKNKGAVASFEELDEKEGLQLGGFEDYLKSGKMIKRTSLQGDLGITERTESYIAWRFKDHPRNRYGILVEGDAGVVFRLGDRGKLREVSIVDIWLRDEKKCDRDIRNLMDGIREKYRPDIISAIMTEDHEYRQSFKGAGFMKAKNNFGFVNLSLDENLDAGAIRWNLMASDIDTF